MTDLSREGVDVVLRLNLLHDFASGKSLCYSAQCIGLSTAPEGKFYLVEYFPQ